MNVFKNTLKSVCFLQQSRRFISAVSTSERVKAFDVPLKTFQNSDKSSAEEARSSGNLGITSDVQRIQASIRELQKQIENFQLFNQNTVFFEEELEQHDSEVQFPRKVQELDTLANTILSAGAEIDADHPGFKDAAYRKRREQLAQIAFNYKQGETIPRVKYTGDEIKAWRAVYERLVNHTMERYACKEYRQVFPLFQKHCGFSPDNVPQLQDISNFLKKSTGFTIRPTAGMLSSRDFLASLAFRVFRCTQYIRHHSKPMFTPEPDACHEILGHVPLLANPDYAQFSQEFGLLSLGASDELIGKLASLYWYTIENGLCLENGQRKIYGAGLLSSPAEVENCFSGEIEIREFDSDVVANEKYPLTDQNWQYFVVSSFDDARRNLLEWALPTRKNHLRYNPYTQSIERLDNLYNLKVFTHELKGDLARFSNVLEQLEN